MYECPYYLLQGHQTKCNGILQTLAMKRDVSAGKHAYDNERIIACVITV
jgi:hypothetical protein